MNVSKQSSGFESQIKPVQLNDTNPIITKKKSSGRESNIQEQISENYDDDDFDIGESLPKEDNKYDNEDFFNQNKNFTGGLAGLGKNGDKEEKQSEPSGLGFEDEYDYF